MAVGKEIFRDKVMEVLILLQGTQMETIDPTTSYMLQVLMLGVHLCFSGETATPTPTPAWLTDSGKIARHTSLRADFPQLANQGSWAKNTHGKETSGRAMCRQKFGSGRPVEASLSSSPSLKGKRDVMAKHSGGVVPSKGFSQFIMLLCMLVQILKMFSFDVYSRLKGVLSQVLPILGNVKDQHRPIFANAFRCWCQACWQYSVEYPLSSILDSDVTNNPSEGVFVGLLLSMSLTTVVLKFLMEKNSVNALHRKVCWYFRKFG
ncbi:unnamed protein product [Lactuca saligna]|uniref:Uncharacterized protein n=1 Tax=Lactuca saligna TaxID=75948 RepID=A0AA35Z191_LACSI|nr:unnamed protein product [Lactuca saligna]